MMSNLNMIQFPLKIPSIMKLAKLKKLPFHVTDMGYLVHCRLMELFGELAPVPFSIQLCKGKNLHLLAYTVYTKDMLYNQAQTIAPPEAFDSLLWEDLFIKPMPGKWIAGQNFVFETKVCPVRRVGKGSQVEKIGAEVDAFLVHARKQENEDGTFTKEEVYRDWLKEHFERSGAVSLNSAMLVSYKRSKLIRRTQGQPRKTVVLERPDIVMKGTLRILDGDKFQIFLKRGIGRHRGFGFGMLLLKSR